MTYRLIGDSCTDLDDNLKKDDKIVIVPLTLEIGDYSVKDDDKFNQKGLFFYELCHCDKRKLLLVFRERMLEDYLRQPEVLAFLQNYGYESYETLADWLLHLRDRIEMSDIFPHEIGVFLGYPLEDVKAFIQFRGAGYKVCGDWKVYGNQASAMHAFHCFRMCRDYCHAQLNKGKSLESLVAVTAC